MPTALVVLILAATFTNPSPAVTQTNPGSPSLVVQMRAGEKIEVPVPRPLAATRTYIVEFNDPPLLARKGRGPVANAASSYRENFGRFRADVAGIRAGKTAVSAAVGHEYFRTFHGVSVTLDAAGVEAVRRFGYVRRVHEDTPVKAFASEDKNRLERLGVERLRSELNLRGDGIVVAVLDTGIDYNHPALGGGIGPSYKVIGGYDFVDGDDDPMDEEGHGTHVSGIIAGTTADVPGVAPNARLIGYRVLNEYGEGSTSNILMAIEWTVDPNSDGDPSDRADVANMSLGGYGDADSPLSLAVDRAVEAGVVFALAAGNTPGEQTIGAPAASRLGITVGSSDSDDLVPYWSSRGPAAPAWELKPEVLAPGSLIRSAKMGGGTLLASGTSMAAPHVAGAVALLLQLHPGWTPADVKAALVGSAHAVEEDVMGQGGGRIDVYGAAKAASAIAPAVVNFGRHARIGAWTATRTVRVTNRAATAETFTASFDSPADIVVLAEPALFTLEPGASRDVVLTAAIGEKAADELARLSHGGRVTFASDDTTVQVPWVAVDAAHVVLTHQLPSNVLWDCDRGPGMSPQYGNFEHRLLMPNRRCDVVSYSSADEGAGPTLISKAVQIADDMTLAFTIADAMYEVRLAGTDRNGNAIGQDRYGYSANTPYVAWYDLEFPTASKFRNVMFNTVSSAPLQASAFDEGFTLSAAEMLYDFKNHRIYSIFHQPLHGIRASATLTTLPSDLRHARVNVLPQRAGTTLSGGGYGDVNVEQGWSGDVYITPDVSRNGWGGASLQTANRPERVWGDIFTPFFHAIDGRIVLSYGNRPSPAAYRVAEGGTITIGETPVWPGTFVDIRDTAFAVFPSFTGPVNESMSGLLYGLHYEFRDDSGTLLSEGTKDGYASADFGRRGAFRATYRAKNGTEVAVRFDTSLPDYNPPSVSSLRIVGGDALVVSRVQPGAPAALAFSVVDINVGADLVARDSRQLRSTRVSWRSGNGAWQELPLTVTLDDRGDPLELKRLETGIHYRADLAAITGSIAGPIDLRIELEDASGNTSASVIKDALIVGPARRRAVR
ncbi:MAG TPA: S8 family serine peptidase [Thermoanaerobaculia bacterium]|nr:S8 family serine peptidase [Thermoanaerobaculia bacterium]